MDEALFRDSLCRHLRSRGKYAGTEIYVPGGRVDVVWLEQSVSDRKGTGLQICGFELKVVKPHVKHLGQFSKYVRYFDWLSLGYPSKFDPRPIVPDIDEPYHASTISPAFQMRHYGRNGGMDFGGCASFGGERDNTYRDSIVFQVMKQCIGGVR